jgi:chromosome segregation ATPase
MNNKIIKVIAIAFILVGCGPTELEKKQQFIDYLEKTARRLHQEKEALEHQLHYSKSDLVSCKSDLDSCESNLQECEEDREY